MAKVIQVDEISVVKTVDWKSYCFEACDLQVGQLGVKSPYHSYIQSAQTSA